MNTYRSNALLRWCLGLALCAAGAEGLAARPQPGEARELGRSGKTAERRLFLVADHLAQFAGYRREAGKLVPKNPQTVGLSALESYYARDVTPASVLEAMFGPGQIHFRATAQGTEVLWGAELDGARRLGTIEGRGKRAQFVPTSDTIQARNRTVGEALVRQLRAKAGEYRQPDPARSSESSEDGLYRASYRIMTYHWKTGEAVYNSVPPSSGMFGRLADALPKPLRGVLRPAHGRKGRAGSPYGPSDAEVALALERPELNRAHEHERPLPIGWRSNVDAVGKPLPEGQWAEHRLLLDGGIAKYSVAIFGAGVKNAVQEHRERGRWLATQKRTLKRGKVKDEEWLVADELFRKTLGLRTDGQKAFFDQMKGLSGYWGKYKTPSHWMAYVFGRGTLRVNGKVEDGWRKVYWDKRGGGSEQVGWLRDDGTERYFYPTAAAQQRRDRVIGELIVEGAHKGRDVWKNTTYGATANDPLPADVAARHYDVFSAGDSWRPSSPWEKIKYQPTLASSALRDLIDPATTADGQPAQVALQWESSRTTRSFASYGSAWYDAGNHGDRFRHAVWMTDKQIIHRVDRLKPAP